MNNHIESIRIVKGFPLKVENDVYQEIYIKKKFLDRAKSFGFTLIKTPLVGFNSTFEMGDIQTTKDKVYTLYDKKNRQLLLSPDSTPQIIRWYLTQPNKTQPIFICFLSEVFRYRKHQQRSWTQYGIATINTFEGDNLKESSLLVLLYFYIEFIVLDLKSNLVLVVGDYSIFSDLLIKEDIRIEEIDNLKNTLRRNKKEEWLKIISTHKLRKEVMIIIEALINFKYEKHETLNLNFFPKDIQLKIKNLISFLELVTNKFNLDYQLRFDSFHSSELQNNIHFRLMYPDYSGHYADGGSYLHYAKKVEKNFKDKYIKSFHSIAGGLLKVNSFTKNKFDICLGILVISNNYSQQLYDITFELRDLGFVSKFLIYKESIKKIITHNNWAEYILILDNNKFKFMDLNNKESFIFDDNHNLNIVKKITNIIREGK